MTITVHPGLLNVCGIPEPKTGLEGKFSLTGTASLALNGIDTSNPETFIDSIIDSPSVQSMIPKIQVETDTDLGQFQSRLVWVDAQQQAHNAFHDLSEPVSDYQAQGKKLEQKFASLCQFGDFDTASLATQVEKLTSASRVVLD